MGERVQRSTDDRVLDTAAGALLSVAALVPLALVAGVVLRSVEGNASFLAVLGGLVALVVSVWCLRTSWRLISGRPRNDGGLLSPWLIAAAGVIFAAWGLLGVVAGGSINRLLHRRVGPVSKRTPRLIGSPTAAAADERHLGKWRMARRW